MGSKSTKTYLEFSQMCQPKANMLGHFQAMCGPLLEEGPQAERLGPLDVVGGR